MYILLLAAKHFVQSTTGLPGKGVSIFIKIAEAGFTDQLSTLFDPIDNAIDGVLAERDGLGNINGIIVLQVLQANGIHLEP